MTKNPLSKSFAEKVSFSISLFIVAIIVTLICYTWVTGDNNPPILTVEMRSQIRQINEQYYIPFTVTNSGGETAESVEIVAQLSLAGMIAEMGRQEFNFLSRQETRKGEFIFNRDPKEGELVIRVASFKLP